MADSTRKTEADRCLEMLMKASKGEGNKLNRKRSYMDLSRKRGRPKKKKNTAVTGIVDLTTSFDSIAVDLCSDIRWLKPLLKVLRRTRGIP